MVTTFFTKVANIISVRTTSANTTGILDDFTNLSMPPTTAPLSIYLNSVLETTMSSKFSTT